MIIVTTNSKRIIAIHEQNDLGHVKCPICESFEFDTIVCAKCGYSIYHDRMNALIEGDVSYS
jgi:predicted nucleic-acid-binding Zn-ribbon protein